MLLDRTAPRTTVAVFVALVTFSGCAISHQARGGEPDASLDVMTPDVADARPGETGPRDVLDVPTDRVGCDASCSGACVNLSSDLHHCGSCGNDCTTLRNVDANRVQCTNGVCVIANACQTGYADCNHAVNDGCEVQVSLPANCGACGNNCPTSAPTCRPASGDAGGPAYVCDTNCAPGQLMCGTACVDSASDPQHCGSCAQACPAPANGAATCSGSACGVSCNPGFHLCGSSCYADNDPDHCGPSCMACPAAANATASCNGTACEYACNSGYHGCTGGCVANTDPAACGATSCAPCPPVANGSPTCDGTSCGFDCNSGYHACGSACVSNNDPANCGSTSCTPCAAVTNGTPTCPSGTCDFTCNGGYHKCGSACASDSDVTMCGAGCTPCSAPANATATCSSSGCGYTCNAGYADTGSACALPDACTIAGSPVTITLGSGDTVTITGTTVGLRDDYSGSCGGSGGPDAVFGVIAAPGTLSATLMPSGFTGVVYMQGLSCGGDADGCQQGSTAGASAMVSKNFALGFAGSVTVDGRNGGASGPFTLTLHVQ